MWYSVSNGSKSCEHVESMEDRSLTREGIYSQTASKNSAQYVYPGRPRKP